MLDLIFCSPFDNEVINRVRILLLALMDCYDKLLGAKLLQIVSWH